ncbi:MAG TPA: hypothetical protein VKU91_01395 [Acidimicrobiales bacterium]|nr:hypothetical protein [Acidimicrobiales bacterium]
MGSLLAAFFAEVVILSYKAYSRSGVPGGGIAVPAEAPIGLPLPSYYTAPILGFGALALVPGQGQQVAALVGWGFVVAAFLNLWPATPAVQKGPVA